MRFTFTFLVLTIAFSFAYSQNKLFIPPIINGTQINLHIKYGTMQFLTGSETKTIGINGNYLGPTIIMNKGDSVLLSVYNDMDESTTMHWHGLHVPPKSDGSPHNVILAHTLWAPRIKISDQASTYWYHNHLHGGETVPESQMAFAPSYS